MQAQLEWFPLGRKPDPTGLASAQWPPVLPNFLFSPEQVGKSDRHVADDRILQKVPIVNDLDRDHGCLFISAHKFCSRLPHGVIGVPEALRSVGWCGVVA